MTSNARSAFPQFLAIRLVEAKKGVLIIEFLFVALQRLSLISTPFLASTRRIARKRRIRERQSRCKNSRAGLNYKQGKAVLLTLT